MNAPDFFIPDRDARTFYPLRDSRSVRAPAVSVAEKYIDALTAPGDLVIDPFGTTPNVARAALALGRRAIIVEPNPLWAWLARSMATLPPGSEIDAALAKLGDALKDDAPLRAHISQLYATTCAACDKSTPADYLIRARDGGIIQRHYTCAHCGQTRDDPATEDDLKRAATFDAHGLHYHVAFQRVVPEDNLHGDRIHKMLDVYTPRNLYALVTLTQKIDLLFHATRERDILLLLLLHLLDRGTSFYATPDATAQLTAHKQFVEFNLWREIEIAARALAQTKPIPLAESVGDVIDSKEPIAFIGRGRAKMLGQIIPRHSAALIVTAPPTRRVAVWALSYFWGAWILGRATAQPLVPFLDAKKDARWEWRWYTDTLNDSLNAMAGMLRDDARAAFVFNEAWQLVIENLLLAASGAHLGLESFLFQPILGDFPHREFDDIRGDYRITFIQTADNRRQTTDADTLDKQIRASALAAGSDILARRGEALAYSWVHHAAYTRIAREGLIDQVVALKSKTPPGRFIHNAVVAGLSEGYARDFDHSETPTQFVWLRRSKELAVPLIDRVDEAVREGLQNHRHFEEPQSGDEKSPSDQRDFSRQNSPLETLAPPARAGVTDMIYRQFSGDLTPEAGLIELCAQAYADAGRIDEEKTRAKAALAKLGERLGYVVVSDFKLQISDSISNRKSAIENFDVAWLANGELAHGFVWRERAQFADAAQVHIAPARGYLVVPESRVALLQEKQRRLPHVADTFHELGWNFVRVPFVEKLLEQETVEQADVALMVGLTPLVSEDKAQLELL